MRTFLDISLSPSDQQQPYLVFLFEDGSISDVTRYADMRAVAEYCRAHPLPVISGEASIRTSLQELGIQSWAPRVREVNGTAHEH
jgi:hypothetical protein